MRFVNLFVATSLLVFATACTRIGDGRKTSETQQGTELIAGSSVDNDGMVIGESENNVVITTSSAKVPKPRQTLHVFIENSGSMNGYINTKSDFQMAIGRAIQLMKFKYGEDNIKTYYINQNVRERQKPEGTDVYKFVQEMLERTDFTTSGTGKADKGTAATDLNDIVKQVLGYVDENNTAILISDFIYSLSSNKGVTTSLLYNCQNLTMSAFLQATKTLPQNISLATNLIQLYSTFDGKYWTWENPTGNKFVLLKCQRPYYMCVLGTDDNVKEFNSDINIGELEGYSNQFTISNKDVSKANYTVFDTKYKKGTYRHANDKSIHAITKAAKNNRNEFELGIGIDLSDFSMSESDKLDKANYKIETGHYEIVAVELIDTTKLATPADKILVRNNHCTHAIILSSTGYPDDISISIKRELPLWVRQASSTDDRYIKDGTDEQKKTFGIEYFVEGISDAYKYLATDKNNFMTIKIKITK